MTVGRPFNEHLLWKGKIQKANYPKLCDKNRKPPMILPEINSLTGKVMNPPDLNSEMNKSYATYSQKYWLDVEERKRIYRLVNSATV
jgi:hypothetical protein